MIVGKISSVIYMIVMGRFGNLQSYSEKRFGVLAQALILLLV